MKIEPFPGEIQRVRVERPFTTKTGAQGRQSIWTIQLTDDQKAWLIRWFPEEENSRLMAASGLTYSTLHRFARQMKLQKSEAGMARIKKRQARHIKKVCERNGYYDSLRGHTPSEACLEGSRERWRRVRAGEMTHHYKNMPTRRYNAMRKRQSENRRELIRKEQLRELYGLPRQTKIRIPMKKFTRSQTCHRCNALRRGYFVMADCSDAGGERYNIYYDQDTNRSELFERNLIKDGFTIKNGVDLV